MSLIDVTFNVEGVTEVAAMFDTAGKRAGNMREPMQNISQVMLKTFDINFAGHGSLFGKWQRRQKDPGHPLLEDTGAMRHGFKGKIGESYVTLFNTQDYFCFHQSNAARKTKLPRRIMMMIDEERRREVIKILQQHIIEG